MICKTCGTELAEGDKTCKKCGMTLIEMGVKPPTSEKAENDDFKERAARFGGVDVKERRGTMFTGIDPKVISIVLIILFLLIFLVSKFVMDQKTNTIKVNNVQVTLPSSMRAVDGAPFEIMNTKFSKSFANSTIEFSCIQYDATLFLPDLELEPGIDDIEGMDRYYSAQNELLDLDKEFPDKLDEAFEDKLEEYKKLSQDGNVLKLTFNENNAVSDKYAEIRVFVKDTTVYQFSLVCSEDFREKYSSKFDKIFTSIKLP